MSEKTAKRAEDLAAQLKERFGATVPTSQAAALLLEFAQSLRASSAEGGKGVSDDDIRRVFLANGFTVKEGQSDLRPYVFQAARALLALAAPPSADRGGDELDLDLVAKMLDGYVEALKMTGAYDIFHTVPEVEAQAESVRAALAAKPSSQVQGEARIADLWRHFAGDNGVVRIERDQFPHLVQAIARLTVATPPTAQQAAQPAQGDCPYAAPFRYCPTCPVSPCPVGLGGSK